MNNGLLNDYIADAGHAVRRALRRGETVELGYTPGNATLYGLVFLPVGADNAALVAARDYMDHEKRLSVFRDDHGYVESEEGWTLVSWLGHGSWLFQLGGERPSVPAAPYIAEKYGASCSAGDAAALAALFDVVAFGTAGRPALAAAS